MLEKLRTKNTVALIIGEVAKLIVMLLLAMCFDGNAIVMAIACGSFAVSILMIFEAVVATDTLFATSEVKKNMYSVFCVEFFISMLVLYTPLFFICEFGDMAIELQILLFMVILFCTSILSAGVVGLVFKFFRELQEYQDEVTDPKAKAKRTVKRKKNEPDKGLEKLEKVEEIIEPEIIGNEK